MLSMIMTKHFESLKFVYSKVISMTLLACTLIGCSQILSNEQVDMLVEALPSAEMQSPAKGLTSKDSIVDRIKYNGQIYNRITSKDSYDLLFKELELPEIDHSHLYPGSLVNARVGFQMANYLDHC